MCSSILILFALILYPAQQLLAADLYPLATCVTKVYSEINRTNAWSGKTPSGCLADVAVEKTTDGVQVTSWLTEEGEDGWRRLAYSTTVRYAEIGNSKELRKANSDLTARAGRLEHCLNSLLTKNDPLDCRYKSTKEYFAEEKVGTERRWVVWIGDEGRRSVVEYLSGDTSVIPFPSPDIFSGQPLPPGTDLHILLR